MTPSHTHGVLDPAPWRVVGHVGSTRVASWLSSTCCFVGDSKRVMGENTSRIVMNVCPTKTLWRHVVSTAVASSRKFFARLDQMFAVFASFELSFGATDSVTFTTKKLSFASPASQPRGRPLRSAAQNCGHVAFTAMKSCGLHVHESPIEHGYVISETERTPWVPRVQTTWRRICCTSTPVCCSSEVTSI